MASLTLLTDALNREAVARARAKDPGEKLLEGPRLFDRACRVMADGVCHRQSDLDDGTLLAGVCERFNVDQTKLEISRLVEEAGRQHGGADRGGAWGLTARGRPCRGLG